MRLQRSIGNQATLRLLQRAASLDASPRSTDAVANDGKSQAVALGNAKADLKPQPIPKAGPGPAIQLGTPGVKGGSLATIPDLPRFDLSANAAGGSAASEEIKKFVTTLGAGDPKAGTRVLLELTRPFPIIGLMTGALSDALGLAQDLESIPDPGNSPLATGVIVTRDVLALINNMLGGAAALDQQIQDAATSSGVGAVADAVTVPVNDGIKTIKLYMDGVQLFLDVAIATDASVNASKAPKGSAERDKWAAIFQNFEASFLTDGIGTVIDYVDLASQGFSNGDNVKTFARWAFNALKAIGPIGQKIVGVINQELSIHGYRVMPNPFASGAPAGTAPAAGGAGPQPQRKFAGDIQRVGNDSSTIAEDVFIDALIVELQQAHAEWAIADAMIGAQEDSFKQLEQQMRAMATQLGGGKDPFIQFRDQIRKGLDHASSSISELTAMGQAGSELVTKSESIISMSDSASAGLQRLRVPEVHVPMPEKGPDDGVTDDLERAGAEAADKLLQAALAPIRSQVDAMRSQAEEPVNTVKSHANDIAEYSKAFVQTCADASGMLQSHITTLSAKLGHVQNFEQVIDLLMRQVTEAMGVKGGIGVDDVRKEWAGIGDTLTDFEGWAQELKKTGPARPRAADNAPPGLSPATPPEL
jgi:hypothetical protein